MKNCYKKLNAQNTLQQKLHDLLNYTRLMLFCSRFHAVMSAMVHWLLGFTSQFWGWRLHLSGKLYTCVVSAFHCMLFWTHFLLQLITRILTFSSSKRRVLNLVCCYMLYLLRYIATHIKQQENWLMSTLFKIVYFVLISNCRVLCYLPEHKLV